MNGIEITDIKIKKLNNLGRLIGEASITLNECLVIHNIQIIQTDERRFISFPHKKLHDKIVDTAHPITREFRSYVEDNIFEMFDRGEVDESIR